MTSYNKKQPDHDAEENAENQEGADRRPQGQSGDPAEEYQPQDDAQLLDERQPILESDEIDVDVIEDRPQTEEERGSEEALPDVSPMAEDSEQIVSADMANDKVTPSRTDPRTEKESRMQSDLDQDRLTRTDTSTHTKRQKDRAKPAEDSATAEAQRRAAKSKRDRTPASASSGSNPKKKSRS